MTDAAAWSGRVGDVWAREWRRTDRTFAGLTPVLDAHILAGSPATGHAIDLGCGAGGTALALATARPGLTVTGLDLSAALIAVATERAALSNLSFRQGDALAVLPSLAPPDLIVSRHGGMFFDDPLAAFTALRRAANRGAALVFSCFASIAANPWATILTDPPASSDIPGPFAFADERRVGTVLRRAGWRDAIPHHIPFTYRAGEGTDPVADAVEFFRRIGPGASALHDASPADRPRLEAPLIETLSAIAPATSSTFPPPRGYGRRAPREARHDHHRPPPQ